MSNLDIQKRVVGMFEEILEVEPGSVKAEQTFEELEIDSVLFIRVVVQCETEFDIQFEDEMLFAAKFPDVKSYISYIETKV